MSNDSTISISERSAPNYRCFWFLFPKTLPRWSPSGSVTPREGPGCPGISHGTSTPTSHQTFFFFFSDRWFQHRYSVAQLKEIKPSPGFERAPRGSRAAPSGAATGRGRAASPSRDPAPCSAAALPWEPPWVLALLALGDGPVTSWRPARPRGPGRARRGARAGGSFGSTGGGPSGGGTFPGPAGSGRSRTSSGRARRRSLEGRREGKDSVIAGISGAVIRRLT